MRTITLADLRTDIRNRGEWFDELWLTNAELNRLINSSIAELYDLVVSLSPDQYLSSSTISVVAGTQTYALPATFYKAQGLDYFDGSRYIPLNRFMWGERGRDTNLNATSTQYRVMGSYIYLEPSPSWSGTCKFWFIPAPSLLSADADTFDGQAGWEEYVILDCSCKIALREESDPGGYMALKSQLTQRITTAARERDLGSPNRITDMFPRARKSNSWEPF